jgi:hypothetical protein
MKGNIESLRESAGLARLFRYSKFNVERFHEALVMKVPAEVHTPSSRSYDGPPDLIIHSMIATSPSPSRRLSGRICMHRKKINVSTVLAGQKLGIK